MLLLHALSFRNESNGPAFIYFHSNMIYDASHVVESRVQRHLHKNSSNPKKPQVKFLLLGSFFYLAGFITSFTLLIPRLSMFSCKRGNFCLVLTSLLFRYDITCLLERVKCGFDSLKKTRSLWGDKALFESWQPATYLEERTDKLRLGFKTLAHLERQWLWKV